MMNISEIFEMDEISCLISEIEKKFEGESVPNIRKNIKNLFSQNISYEKCYQISKALSNNNIYEVRFLASKYPTLINRLVLMSAAASFKIGFERPAFSRNEFRHQLEETNQRAYKFFFSDDYPEISKKILNNWLNVDFDVHMEMIKLKHPNLTEDARMIQCKTLILTGNKDKATTVEDGKKLSELIEKGKFAVIPGSHYMFLENPNAVEKIIKEFLTNEFKNSDN